MRSAATSSASGRRRILFMRENQWKRKQRPDWRSFSLFQGLQASLVGLRTLCVSFRQMTPEQRRKQWTGNLLPGQFRHLFDHLPGTLVFRQGPRGTPDGRQSGVRETLRFPDRGRNRRHRPTAMIFPVQTRREIPQGRRARDGHRQTDARPHRVVSQPRRQTRVVHHRQAPALRSLTARSAASAAPSAVTKPSARPCNPISNSPPWPIT